MSQWLIGLAALVGIAAFMRASWAARMLMLESPDGEELPTINRLGMWQFKEIERINGPDFRRHIEAYKTSSIFFLAAVLGGLIVGAFFWDPSLTPPDTTL